jgi:hypothetical protein
MGHFRPSRTRPPFVRLPPDSRPLAALQRDSAVGQFQTHAAHIFFGTIERGFDFPAIISVRQD